MDREDRMQQASTKSDSGTAGHDYREETAAELSAPAYTNRREEPVSEDGMVSRFYGWASLFLAVLSLFFLPVLLGASAIVLGLIARGKGAGTTGAWAIGIGAVSLILGLFVFPFF
ncbi:hypothetical protein [Weizmannia acidilactici]|uniref:hypothetical protein n=1 Tax=Weizmannia acidilactici TaxID=2607726 RepID=UPI0015625E16|nr:hypothetical protein [Weizmannia acidilactici]